MSITEILIIQGDIKIDLINAGLSQEDAQELAGKIVQYFLDKKLIKL